MLIEGQNSVKKELVKRFPSEDFTYIDDIFPEQEGHEDEQEEERQSKDNPIDQVSIDNVVDVENTDVMETREEESEDPPLM